MPDEPTLAVRIGTTYDAKRKQFRSRGRLISRQATRAEIDLLTQQVSKDAFKIGNLYANGKINLAEFEIRIRELLKSGHIVAASVGRGGRERMTLSDWGVTGNRIKQEYGYLKLFVDKLQKGIVAKAVTPYRAKLYSSSIVMSYHKTVLKEQTLNSVTDIKVRLIQNSAEGCDECTADAAEGWMAVEDFTELGDRICGPFCRCDAVFSDDVAS